MNFAPLLARPVPPAIVSTARYFQDLAPGDTLPRRSDFRPTQIRSVLGFVFLIDVLPGNYRWDLIGEHIAVLFGLDGTGSLLSQLEPAPLRDRLRATYDAVVKSESYLYGRGRYTWPDHAVAIERLLIPMADREGRLSSIFGMTIPDAPTDLLHLFVGAGAATLEIDETLSGA